MSRRRKSDTESIENAFYDMNFTEQAETLRLLGILHRLKGRNVEAVVAKSVERTPGAAGILGEPE